MNTVAIGRLQARPASGESIFVVLTALVWVGVLSGFGTDAYQHIKTHGLDYPPVVHVHALVFLSFLAVFSTQVALIRTGRIATHRRLGQAAALLIVLMLMLGPLTAVLVDAHRYVTTGRTPEFLAVQLTDMIAFGTLAGAGLWLRTTPTSHKRLMMLALIYISDAGFARFINDHVSAPLGEGFWGDMFGLYFGSDLLMLGLGISDLITRRALHPAYVAGVAWALCMELTALAGWHSAAWKALALHIIGWVPH
jgi:hypothetical protein